MQNLYVFWTFLPLLKKSARDKDAILPDTLATLCTANQWRWCLWQAQLGIDYAWFMRFLFFCSKIIWYCWDKFDYPGSIVYLFCLDYTQLVALIISLNADLGRWDNQEYSVGVTCFLPYDLNCILPLDQCLKRNIWDTKISLLACWCL